MRLKAYFIGSIVLIPSLCAGPISQLVVFGDSLSDNGNAAIALGGTLPGNYSANAFTDGPKTTPATSDPFGLWVDQFAADLGVADPQPFLAGGTNYAVASALTGHDPTFSIPPTLTSVPYTADQVALFTSSQTVSPNSLYTFWAGANDINSGMNPITAANNIESNIETLAVDGATQFLWLNVPLLGDTPDGVASGQSALLNEASVVFDTTWSTDIAALQKQGIDVVGVNVEQLFNQITADPALYGFTNVTNPAWCGTGGLSTCAANNPNQFVFWDGEHPTTAADAQIANLAFNDFTAVPEPASLGLSFAGLCALLPASVKIRRARHLRVP